MQRSSDSPPIPALFVTRGDVVPSFTRLTMNTLVAPIVSSILMLAVSAPPPAQDGVDGLTELVES